MRDINIIPAAYANEVASSTAMIPLNPDGTITVRMAPNEEVHVDITSISTSDELEVNIEEVNGRSIYDAIPVEIE